MPYVETPNPYISLLKKMQMENDTKHIDFENNFFFKNNQLY